ncbi:MAG: hypothetical protein U9P72_02195 [Campylobacterota bacterium]|nr:hypothetical protein [Campylobacterota bacterium]
MVFIFLPCIVYPLVKKDTHQEINGNYFIEMAVGRMAYIFDYVVFDGGLTDITAEIKDIIDENNSVEKTSINQKVVNSQMKPMNDAIKNGDL